jgi:hypothetical protein
MPGVGTPDRWWPIRQRAVGPVSFRVRRNASTLFHEHIDKNAATTRWRGEKMDYGLAIEVLLQHARRPPRVSAETR